MRHFHLILVLALPLLMGGCDVVNDAVGGSDVYCHCDVIEEESTCIETSGPQTYTVQVGASCEGVIHGTCEASQAGSYDGNDPCPSDGAYAVCIDDTAGFKVSKYFYTTGTEPYGPDRHDDIESDCSTGNITYF